MSRLDNTTRVLISLSSRTRRDQSLGDSSGSGSGSGSGATASGLAAAQKALHRAGSSLSIAAGEAPSLAALSQLGQSSLETLRSRATGLFGKLGSTASTSTSTSSEAGAGAGVPSPHPTGGPAGALPPPLDVHEVGSFLKGTVLSVAKRAEQAMEARGVKVPPFGSGGGSSTASPASAGGGGGALPPSSPGVAASSSSSSPSVFVIEDDEAEDEDDEEGRGGGKRGQQGQQGQQAPTPPPQQQRLLHQPAEGGNMRTSELDRELALKLHALNGLQKGQEVEVSPEALPGGQLFDVYKQKVGAAGEGEVSEARRGEGGAGPPEWLDLIEWAHPSRACVRPPPPFLMKKQQVQELPRYIALTAERMLVLEAAGGLMGRVKSNRHLTELVGSVGSGSVWMLSPPLPFTKP